MPDDPKLVKLLRRYLKQTQLSARATISSSEKTAPVARCVTNPFKNGGLATMPRRILFVPCANCATHPTELINCGVSLNTTRKRLGHKNLQTTLRYAEQSDAITDQELRAWRRQLQSR